MWQKGLVGSLAVGIMVTGVLAFDALRSPNIDNAAEAAVVIPEPESPDLMMDTLDIVTEEDIPKPDYANVVDIPVLMYHHINTIPAGFENDAILFDLSVSPAAFEAQIQALSDNGYNSLTIDEYHNILHGFDTAPDKAIMLAFDDGYQDNYDYAFPILEKYNQKGNFALVSGVMGTSEYMSWENAQEIVETGHGIISHTHLHCSLAQKITGENEISFAENYIDDEYRPCPGFVYSGQLSTGEVLHEVQESKKILEEKLNIIVDSFIYPFGNYNPQTVVALEDSNYKTAFTIQPALGTQSQQPLLELPRIRIHGQQDDVLSGFFSSL